MPRILVIDDEPFVALMIRRTLEPSYEVAVEHSVKAASDRLSAGERFDAVIADLHLADGTAIAIREHLRGIDPSLAARLLVLTGGAGSGAETAFLEEPGTRWLQKPFRTVELLTRLEDVLRSSSARR